MKPARNIQQSNTRIIILKSIDSVGYNAVRDNTSLHSFV